MSLFLDHHHGRTKHVSHNRHNAAVPQKRQQATQQPGNVPNRFCTCAVESCNCCRNFSLPLLNIKGPGCATLQYLPSNELAISMSFNERVLTNTTIRGKMISKNIKDVVD